MKVLLVGAYPPPYGGVQVHLAQLERFLEGKGHPCFVINMGKNKTLRSSKVVSPTTPIQVALYLLNKRDHVCHLHFGGNLHTKLLLLSLFSNMLFYKRCAVTIHSGGLSVWGQPKNPIKRILFCLSLVLCRTVICVNPKIAEYFEKLGVKPEKIYIIPPFAFENELNNGPLPKVISSFIKDKKPLLCNIGLLEPEYDLELLLRVFRRFVMKNPEAGLVMIGSGSLHGRLKKAIAELQLHGKALLTGDISHSNTLKILASSDCYVRPSRYDGDCISLKEAIHLGIPAIASDTGLRPQEAILFPIGDEEALLRTIMHAVPGSSRVKKIFHESDFSCLATVEKILLGMHEKTVYGSE